MKKSKAILFILFLIFANFSYGQESKGKRMKSSYSVFAETPLFISLLGKDRIIIDANFEYLLHTRNKTSFIIGYGCIIWTKYWSCSAPVIKAEFNKLFGGKNQYFEIGAGLSSAVGALANFRFGYRAVIWKRLLVRVAYTPFFYILSGEHWFSEVNNTVSVAIGYRFGKNR